MATSRPLPIHVLVSRTDRIGDVVLALPLCGLLRERLGARVTFLGSAYTRPVTEASDSVDAFCEWNAAETPRRCRQLLADVGADVVLHLFPRSDIARAAWSARVPVRVGTSHRMYHWLYCNRLEPLTRRRSTLHEAQLNVQLARSLLPAADLALAPTALAAFGRVRPRAPLNAALAQALDPARFTLVLHPRSLGSAPEWPLSHYRALIDTLPPDRFRVLVTGTCEDGVAMRDWLSTLPPHAIDLTGRASLAELITLMGVVDGVIAASTGPLHLAAAVGRPTLGLYARRRPVHPGRWSPLGAHADVLLPPEDGPEAVDAAASAPTLERIPVQGVRERVEAWYAEWLLSARLRHTRASMV